MDVVFDPVPQTAHRPRGVPSSLSLVRATGGRGHLHVAGGSLDSSARAG